MRGSRLWGEIQTGQENVSSPVVITCPSVCKCRAVGSGMQGLCEYGAWSSAVPCVSRWIGHLGGQQGRYLGRDWVKKYAHKKCNAEALSGLLWWQCWILQ